MIQNYGFSSEKPRKRRVISYQECMHDLKEVLPLLFQAFNEAFTLYEKEIIQTGPEARPRGFEATLLNAKIIQCIQKHFPVNWRFGKYKRFILGVDGYIVLFKKLNGKNMPMNIKTRMVRAISNQLTLPLFANSTQVENPILFFGYKKDRAGNIIDPKLVYIDEGEVSWTITANDITDTDSDASIVPQNDTPAGPTVKPGVAKKDTSSNK